MSGARPDPFWVCHECRAEMRPVMRDGVQHCASCDSEFIEILDTEVNPDPFHELPPPPPTRPRLNDASRPRPSSAPPDQDDYAGLGGAGGGFFQQLFGGMMGSAMSPQHDPGSDQRSSSQPGSPGPSNQVRGQQGGGPGVRTWNFDGGNGYFSISFGSVPIGPVPGRGGEDDDEEDLGNFLPGGFGMPPNARAQRPWNPFDNGGHHHARPGDPTGLEDIMRALMGALGDDMHGPGGPSGRGPANFGDYVMTENGFDQILEQLMHAAGPQGPIPASDVVIEGLPRFSLTQESLEKSQFKDCPVCKDDFNIGEEVMRIPCGHLFHPDCLQPWLRTNGSCPVCRFSLVPEESEREERQSPAEQTAQATPANDTNPSQEFIARGPQSPTTEPPNIIQNVLQRLWGQSGASNPTSPISETGPRSLPGTNPHSPLTSPGLTGPSQGTRLATQTTPEQHSGAQRSQDDDLSVNIQVDMSSAIPEDYRERHRKKEQQQQQEEHPHEDLD